MLRERDPWQARATAQWNNNESSLKYGGRHHEKQRR